MGNSHPHYTYIQHLKLCMKGIPCCIYCIVVSFSVFSVNYRSEKVIILHVLVNVQYGHSEKALNPLYSDGLLTLCILMDYSTHIETISMELPIVYYKGSQVEFSKL